MELFREWPCLDFPSEVTLGHNFGRRDQFRLKSQPGQVTGSPVDLSSHLKVAGVTGSLTRAADHKGKVSRD